MLLGNFPSRESDGEAAAAATLEHPTFELDFREILSDWTIKYGMRSAYTADSKQGIVSRIVRLLLH